MISLYYLDGTRIVRHPAIDAGSGGNIEHTADFKIFARELSGSFIADSPHDGTERHYASTRIGNSPLVRNVALATANIEAEWRAGCW